MKGKLLVAVLVAALLGAVGVGAAAATAPKPAKKKPVPAKKFDERYDCAKVAPAAWLISEFGGYGGALTLKPKASSTALADYPPNKGGVGGESDCNYQETGFPYSPTSEGPVEIRIAYGTNALWWYKAMHAGAVAAAAHCTTPTCGPKPVAGVGDQAYVDGGGQLNGYLAALRGEVFVLVAIEPSANADHTQVVPLPDGLMASIAQALLARLPAM